MKSFKLSPLSSTVISISANIAARIPSLASVAIVLPKLSLSLGSSRYGLLLVAAALGSFCSIPFSACATSARRLVSKAFSTQDQTAEADGFATSTLVGFILAPAPFIMSLFYYFFIQKATWPIELAFTTALVSFTSLLNIFDNIRSAYNQHFVTAGFQCVFQTIVAVIFYLNIVSVHSIWLAALMIQGPFLAASISTMALLMIERPYLALGRPSYFKQVIASGSLMMTADGLFTAIISLSVVFLGAIWGAAFASWYGTLIRLFQTLVTPALLILVPLSSFAALKWVTGSAHLRRLILRLIILSSVIYALAMSAVMYIMGRLVIGKFFHIHYQEQPSMMVAFCGIMFSYMMYKSYTVIIYTLDEARALTSRVVFGLLAALMLFAGTKALFSWRDAVMGFGGGVTIIIASIAFNDYFGRIQRVSTHP